MEKKENNSMEMLLNRLKENKKSLHISRIPENTKKAFVDLSNNEFCGDYGMTLKWLIDGIINQDNVLILDKISEIESRINVLEQMKKSGNNDDSEKRKMLNGKVVRRYD